MENEVEKSKKKMIDYFDSLVVSMGNEEVHELSTELADYFNVFAEGMEVSIVG